MNDFVDIGLPDKMNITRQYDSMTIIRKWFGWDVIFITVFAVIWNGIIFKNYSNLESYESLPWIHILVGVFISYYAITGMFNKTSIYIKTAHTS